MLFLTRHGRSEANARGTLGGDSGLTAEGERYAWALPAVLEARTGGAVVEVWTSTLQRTRQTAKHLPFPQLRLPELDEIDAGVCEGLTYAQIAERMPEEFAARKKDKLGYRYPGGESYLDLIQRLQPVMSRLQRCETALCIVAHQAVLRVVYGHLMAEPLEAITSLEVPLHTLIEMTRLADGAWAAQFLPVDIGAAPKEVDGLQLQLSLGVPLAANCATCAVEPVEAEAAAAAAVTGVAAYA